MSEQQAARNQKHGAEEDSESSSFVNSDSKETLTFWQTTQSVLFAMLGVQKEANAKRDFSKGKASHFIILGIAFGVVFVASVALVVSLILDYATR